MGSRWDAQLKHERLRLVGGGGGGGEGEGEGQRWDIWMAVPEWEECQAKEYATKEAAQIRG